MGSIVRTIQRHRMEPMAFETDLAYRRLKPDEQERHLNGLDDESIPQHNVSVDHLHNAKRSMTSM
jgi:hypothetical protein